MSAAARYAIPRERHRVEQVIDRSRFICTVAPAATVHDAQAFIREIDAEFRDATHNCWAYVVGPAGSTNQVGMSDDGEPHGTAGRPMLTVLLHGGVGDIVTVVTRYYGGTKLGTGGLVKAYGGSVQLALESLPTTQRVELTELSVVVGYADISALQQLWAAHEVEVMHDEYGADVRYRLRLPVEQRASLEQAICNVTRGQGEIRDA